MISTIKQFFKDLEARIGSPYLDWVQIEVSTHCNAVCTYCPHTLNSDKAEKQNMTIEAFREVITNFPYSKLIYLQGWGEPLLNDDLYEMIRLCKKKGKQVGFTTNGMLLSEDRIQKLIELELDILCISLAGTTSATHNKIRKGTDFDKIVRNLELLSRMKAKNKASFPSLHLAYLMLKSNFHELKNVLPLAKKWGVKQIIASNLTLIVKEDLYPEALFLDKANQGYYINTLEEIEESAVRGGILFSCNKPILVSPQACGENIPHSCVVSVEGDLCPCIDTVPAAGEKALSFGKLNNESLTRIWNKKEYYDFRKTFSSKNADTGGREIPASCSSCFKNFGV